VFSFQFHTAVFINLQHAKFGVSNNNKKNNNNNNNNNSDVHEGHPQRVASSGHDNVSAYLMSCVSVCV